MANLPIGYSVRLAIVRKVYRTYVECIYTDSPAESKFKCPIPYPYAGQGGGIFAGIEKDTRVLVSMAPQEQPYIVGIIPDRGFYFDQDGVPDTPIFSTAYPEVASGEICLKSIAGSNMFLSANGNISFDAGIGDDAVDMEFSKSCEALFLRTNNVYRFSEAGRSIEGVVKRDRGEEEDPEDTALLNFLSGESYDEILSKVGRSPEDEVQLRTVKISKSVVRNPALVEKRDITYEYANSFGVRGLPFEVQAMTAIKSNAINESFQNFQNDPSLRENRRTDILNLNLRNYNHLIEKVEGTVVDIYGNILDINRNIIRVPEVEDIDTNKNDVTQAGLRRVYNYLRRSIKYHFEINSRKEINDIEPSIVKPGYNAKDHSRWSIDVDGEGLTKINIPASSETGNIPILGRYVVSKNEELSKRDEGQYKDKELRDIKVIQFGAKENSAPSGKFAGQQICNQDYIPVAADNASITAGTGFHDLMNVASSILQGGKLRDPKASGGASAPAMTTNLNNKIPELENGNFDPALNKDANAGGRSLHANLDGSAEVSIGADTADRKSIVLDLAGGVISHYGRDRNGRSLIHQTDGDVIIQVGGPGITDERFKQSDNSDTEDRPGRIEIHLNRPGSGAENQKIIIDENGITIDIIGNGIFKTSGDLTLSAGGKLLFTGERIFAYGSVDDSIDGTRAIKGGESFISRAGRKI